MDLGIGKTGGAAVVEASDTFRIPAAASDSFAIVKIVAGKEIGILARDLRKARRSLLGGEGRGSHRYRGQGSNRSCEAAASLRNGPKPMKGA